MSAAQLQDRHTGLDPDQPTAPQGLVGRDFSADRARVKLVGEISYIPAWTGLPYLATVIDCNPRTVIGWSMADHKFEEPANWAIRARTDGGLLIPNRYTCHWLIMVRKAGKE